MNLSINQPNFVVANNLDQRWKDETVYNHYDNPLDFMHDVIDNKHLAEVSSKAQGYIEQGIKAYSLIDTKNTTYDKKYQAIAEEVKRKLIARGFTTKLLYADVEFTSQKTGVMSKQRAMMGRPDCYYKNTAMTDGKLFHDLYINMSYSGWIEDEVIEKKSYALYALVKELSRLIPMRVFVVNHVGHNTKSGHNKEEYIEGSCYSYVLKKFGMAINPKEFLFFTSDSKRTFGWASYDMVCGKRVDADVGRPTGTVSIADLDLDKEIDNIWTKFQQHNSHGNF